jgi:O-antigen/teichoic acid export membrane protein
VRPKKSGLFVRNVMYLGIGQVATTALGVVLTAALGRALGPSDFGVLFTVLAICAFVGFVVDWGQSTYVIREIARGRCDEAEFIGSALLIGVVGSVCAAAMAVAIALAAGYDERIVLLAPLAVIVALPTSLGQRFCSLFRGKDRMDLDVIVGIVGKALTLAATLITLYLGGGVLEVILAQCVGGIASLVAAAFIALRLGVKVGAPAFRALRELLWFGAPIVALSLVTALQPFTEVMMLSAFTGSEVVGWYGAGRTIFGIITSPGMILATAAFPVLSRVSLSGPDLQRVLESTARIMLVAAAFASSALYLFADQIVSIIYGHGRFEQTSEILRAGAIFLPIFFLGYLFAIAMFAIGKTKEFAFIGWVKLAAVTIFNLFAIDFCQTHFGNGSIALLVTSGATEIFVVISVIPLLPRGALDRTTLLNFVRACMVSIFAVLALSALPPLGPWFLAPLFALTFALAAMAAKLILPSDLSAALGFVRDGLLDLREKKIAAAEIHGPSER